MRDLMAATGETADLGVQRGDQALFVSQVETHAAIPAFFPPGTLSPPHASGVGKAILSQRTPEQVDRFLAETALEAFTPSALADPAALREDLRAAHDRGQAMDDEERNLGMRRVAAPVLDALGEAVAGVSVSGPASRFGEADVPRLAAHLVEAARALSRALVAGGRPRRGLGRLT